MNIILIANVRVWHGTYIGLSSICETQQPYYKIMVVLQL